MAGRLIAMLADIRAYDRCETGKRRGEYRYQYGQDQNRRPHLHRCEAPSELRDAIERRMYYEKPIDVARRLHEHRDDPDGGHGRRPLCRGCFRRALREGFTPDQWEELHAKAARQPRGKHAKFPKPFKPTQNHPREEKPEKTYARIVASIEKEMRSLGDTKAKGIIGRTCGDGYILAATDGHVAVIRRGKGKEKTITLTDTAPEWIDLPPEFQLALKRVALLANERSNAVTFTVDRVDSAPRLTLTARSPEYGEASEWIPITSHNLPGTDPDHPLLSTFEPFTVCLSAEYVDLFCGIWPLRWYLRRPRTYERKRAWRRNDEPEMETITEDVYQAMQPAGVDWRLIVMPMRI